MTKTEYEEWFQETAAQDCSLVEELKITDLSHNTTTYTQSSSPDVCTKMSTGINANDVEKIVFSGVDEEEVPWTAIDELQGSNIIRKTNGANPDGVPKNIIRPINN